MRGQWDFEIHSERAINRKECKSLLNSRQLADVWKVNGITDGHENDKHNTIQFNSVCAAVAMCHHRVMNEIRFEFVRLWAGQMNEPHSSFISLRTVQ